MLLAPRLAGVADLLAQQKTANALAAAYQILNRSAARTDEIAHCLMRRIRNPDGRELLRPQQLDQGQAIAPIGLHPHARPARRERRRHHFTAHLWLGVEAPINAVAARPSLITNLQPPATLLEPLDHPIKCRRLVGNLAPVTHLTSRQRLRYRHINLILPCIQSDVEDMLVHERSPMLEARRRPVRRNPRIACAETARFFLHRTCRLRSSRDIVARASRRMATRMELASILRDGRAQTRAASSG